MHNLVALSAFWVMPTHTGTEALAILLRWVHLLAGITWIGLLFLVLFPEGGRMFAFWVRYVNRKRQSRLSLKSGG